MKRNESDVPETLGAAEEATHVYAGDRLWTLTRDSSTAEARCWHTATGLELELHIWTGPRVAGHEDLALCQRFPTPVALEEAAATKKRQLEAAGWKQDIETTLA